MFFILVDAERVIAARDLAKIEAPEPVVRHAQPLAAQVVRGGVQGGQSEAVVAQERQHPVPEFGRIAGGSAFDFAAGRFQVGRHVVRGNAVVGRRRSFAVAGKITIAKLHEHVFLHGGGPVRRAKDMAKGKGDGSNSELHLSLSSQICVAKKSLAPGSRRVVVGMPFFSKVSSPLSGKSFK